MILEEKLHKELDWLEIKHIDADGIIRNILSICQQEIDEACKKQREICARIYDEGLTSGVLNPNAMTMMYPRIKNAPSPKEIE